MKLVIVLLAFCLMPAVVSAQEALPPALLEGEVILQFSRTSESGGAARAQMLVHGDRPAEALWAVIVSCPMAFVYVQGMEKCEVLDDQGSHARVHQVVDPSWLVPAQDYVFESLRDPFREIRFNLLEGNIDVLEGYWRFTPRREGLLVDYEMRVVPSLPAPRFLVRRIVRRGMPDLLACIRGLAGGSGSAASTKKDLGRCPGESPESQ